MRQSLIECEAEISSSSKLMISHQTITIDSLTTILQKHKIDTTKWNPSQGHKTIAELHQEIQTGESQLDIIKGQITRLVRVSSIDVRFKLGDNYFQLVEEQQILFCGAIKKRNLSTITEKLKAGESFLEGAYRGLEEEIGWKSDIDLNFIGETKFEQFSQNYPTLNSSYQVFNYQLMLGEKELGSVRFSEYVPHEKRINLFTLKPLN